MNDYFTFKGISCATCGIVVTELPEIILAAERVTFTDVPGRSGSLTSLEGTDVYADITYTIQCYVDDTSNVANIAKFFKGSGKLVLPNRPGGYYEGRVINQIPFEKILRGNAPRSFAVNFRLKPFFHLDSGDTSVSIPTSGTTLTNPTGFISKPLITIVGSGDIGFLVGSQVMALTGITSGVTLDSESGEAYYT